MLFRSVKMGDYNDFCMHPPGDAQPVAGICHAKGENMGLPTVWLIYITVDDLDLGIRRCQELGGKLLRPATTTISACTRPATRNRLPASATPRARMWGSLPCG